MASDTPPATYADAVATGRITAWLMAHPCSRMPLTVALPPSAWTRAVQLPLPIAERQVAA